MYAEDTREQEMLGNSVLSQRVGESNYLYSETATCIGSREQIKGNNIQDKRNRMRTELHIWLID